MKTVWIAAAGWVLATLVQPALAGGLAEAWQAALDHDAQYRAAGHERDAAREGVTMAQAARWPQANLVASQSSVTGVRDIDSGTQQSMRLPLDYSSPQTSLQLRMPLFNDEVLARIGGAQAQADAAEALYRLRRGELADRLGTAYLAVLLARDNQQLAEQQAGLSQQQLQRAERRLAQGEGTRVEMAQAAAALESARARVAEARDRVEVALRDLRRVVGRPLESWPVSLEAYQPAALQPAGLSHWLDLAQSGNAGLELRRMQIEAARFNVRRNRAGHLPRLDAVANVSKSSNESLSSLNQESLTRQLGVQLTVPLFSGGGVQAGVRQAQAEQARAEEELRALSENVELEVQRHYLGVSTGQTRIQAQRAVVDAAEVALRAAQRAVDEGVGTLAQVIEAQAQWFVARRDLAQIRQEHLLSRLRLFTQAGRSADLIIEDIDRQLEASNPAKAQS